MTPPRHQAFGALFCLLLIATACSSGTDNSTMTTRSSSAPVPVTTDPSVPTTPPVDDSATARAVLDAWVTDHPQSAASAFSVGISRAGFDPVIAVSGQRDGEPVTVDDWFRLGSVTKTYTAAALLRLVDDGRLNLDVPIATYTDAVPAADLLTTRQLLTHTSGLPDYLANPAWFESVSSEQNRTWTAADVFSLVDAGDVQPGSFSYSNTNYVAAGLVLEAITELSLRDAVDQLVLTPAGLISTDTTSDGHDVVDGVIDVGDGTIVETTDLDSYLAIETSAGSAGSMSATPDDLLAFGRALLDGDLLSADTFAAMFATTVDMPYGLGIANWELIEGGRFVGYGNYGEIPGYSAMLLVDPASGLVLTATGGDDRAPVDALAAELQRAVTSGAVPSRAASSSTPIQPDDATRQPFDARVAECSRPSGMELAGDGASVDAPHPSGVPDCVGLLLAQSADIEGSERPPTRWPRFGRLACGEPGTRFEYPTSRSSRRHVARFANSCNLRRAWSWPPDLGQATAGGGAALSMAAGTTRNVSMARATSWAATTGSVRGR